MLMAQWYGIIRLPYIGSREWHQFGAGGAQRFRDGNQPKIILGDSVKYFVGIQVWVKI